MHPSPESKSQQPSAGSTEITNNRLANLAIKQIEFNTHNGSDLYSIRLRNMKMVMPGKLAAHGRFQCQNRNKKMLPGLQFRQVGSAKLKDQQKCNTFDDRHYGKSLRNARNSQILNSLIEILKTDPDGQQFDRPRNGRMRTEPSYPNQFIESREISSVKNSRMPKIINNEIMMAGSSKTKRNLVSEEKSRSKQYGEEPYLRPIGKKADPFDQMQMTFYRPSRILSTQHSSNPNTNTNTITTMVPTKVEQNQFIML